MKRWALVGGLVAGLLLAGIVGVVALFSNSGCAVLTLERADDAQAVALDEARVRDEAPTLAALLDRAVADGRATEDHEQTARAMHRYLSEATEGRPQSVSWTGVPLRALLAVC